MKEQQLTLWQRAVIERLREAGFTALAEDAARSVVAGEMDPHREARGE